MGAGLLLPAPIRPSPSHQDQSTKNFKARFAPRGCCSLAAMLQSAPGPKIYGSRKSAKQHLASNIRSESIARRCTARTARASEPG